MDYKEEFNSTFATALDQAAIYLNQDLLGLALTDMFVRINYQEETITLFDEEEHQLAQTAFPPMNQQEQEEERVWDAKRKRELERTLRTILQRKNEEGYFDSMNLLKPFSVVLLDNSFSVQTELFTLDDDLLILDDQLIADWENDFNQLMEKISEQE